MVLFRRNGTFQQVNLGIITDFKDEINNSFSVSRITSSGNIVNSDTSIYSPTYQFIFGLSEAKIFDKTFSSQAAFVTGWDSNYLCTSFTEAVDSYGFSQVHGDLTTLWSDRTAYMNSHVLGGTPVSANTQALSASNAMLVWPHNEEGFICEYDLTTTHVPSA